MSAGESPMPWPLRLVRSCLAFALAPAAGMGVVVTGDQLAHALRLPLGNTWRLAWDLAWVALAGIAMLVVCARVAPTHKRAHAMVLWLAIAAACVYATVELGGDFPRWFVVVLLTSLPLQAWLGLRWGVSRKP